MHGIQRKEKLMTICEKVTVKTSIKYTGVTQTVDSVCCQHMSTFNPTRCWLGISKMNIFHIPMSCYLFISEVLQYAHFSDSCHT